MRFYKLLQTDLKQGVLRKRYFAAATPALFCLVSMQMEWSEYRIADHFTDADLQMYAFRGMPLHSGITDVPPLWLFICLLFLLMNLTYTPDGFTGYGRQIFIRSGSRRQWWLSKCLWSYGSAIVYIALFDLFLGLGAIFLGADKYFQASKVWMNINFSVTRTLLARQILILTFLLPAVSLAVFSVVQSVLSLVFTEAVSFYMTLASLIVMSFMDSVLLPLNGLMILRSRMITEEGYSPAWEFLAALLWSAALFAAGDVMIRRKSVVSKKEGGGREG